MSLARSRQAGGALWGAYEGQNTRMGATTDPEGKFVVMGAAVGGLDAETERVKNSNTCHVPVTRIRVMLRLSSLHLRPLTNYIPSWRACVTTSKRAKFSVGLVVIHDE